MNKKVMAVAVAGVLAAPAAAFAQSSNVQLYGRANLGFDHYQATGARDQGNTPGSAIDYDGRYRVFDSASRVGLRGTEDLGNGLKAIFQIETGVNIDNGSNTGQNGAVNASSGFWASRDSFVGLDSNWGRIALGRLSTYWANGVNAQHAANYVNTEVPWLNGTQLGRVSRPTAGAGPVARYSNSVQYTTPTFFGLNATLSYSPNNQEAVQHTTSADVDGRMWGATVRGSWGPFYAQYDYAHNRNNAPTIPVGVNGVPIAALGAAAGSVQGFWEGHKAGVSWGYMPGARIAFLFVRTNTNNALGVTAGDKVNQNGYGLNWEHTFGNFQVLAEYGWTDNIKGCDGGTGTAAAPGTVSCDNTKSQGFMVGGRYFMSKRTWLYATYNRVNNKDNQFADYVGANITSVSGNGPSATPYGADPQIIAVGVFHQF